MSVSGEDENAALNLLDEKFGLAPVELKNVEEGSIQKGKTIALRVSGVELCVDLGVFVPKPTDAFISIQHLQALLTDGKRLPLRQVARLFCLESNFPLGILIKRLDHKRNRFDAELGEKQIELFSEWTRSNLERLIVLGDFYENVERAVKTSGHWRDVAEIENLGLLEHAIVCKLGTYAAGLIPKIGRLLPNASLKIFLPKEIKRVADISR